MDRGKMPEAAKEVLRTEPDAKGVTTGTGISRKLVSDITAKGGEAGGEHAGTAPGLGAHAAPGSAASGMKHHHHHRDFEERTNEMAVGAETPDGPLQPLALHHDHGKEGSGSKADKELDEVIHHHQHTTA